MVKNIEAAFDIAKQQVNRDETYSALGRTLRSSLYSTLFINSASSQTLVKV